MTVLAVEMRMWRRCAQRASWVNSVRQHVWGVNSLRQLGSVQGMACRLMDWGGRVLAHPWRMRRRDRPHQLGLGVSLAFRIWLCYHHQSGMFFFASMTISESIVIAMISYLHLCGLLRHDSTGRTRFVNIIVLAAGIATKKIFKLSRPCCVTVIPNFH